jgi:small GTP-binding protein
MSSSESFLNIHHQHKHSSEKKNEAREYFLKKVDSILTKLIENILTTHPENVIEFMLIYFKNYDPGNYEVAFPTPKRLITDYKPYFNQEVAPYLKKLMSNLIINQPIDIITYIINYLSSVTELQNVNVTENSSSIHSQNNDEFVKKSSARLKLEDAKTFAESIIQSRPSTARIRNKIEDAISLGMSIQNSSSVKAHLEITSVQEFNDKINKSLIFHSDIHPSNQKNITIRIGLFGLGGSGKSSILNTLQGILDITKPTIGFRPITMSINEFTKIQFYDLGGMDKIRGIWNQYYHDIHGYIYVIDSSSDIPDITKSIQIYNDITSNPYLINKPRLIFANKCDVVSSSKIMEICDLFCQNAEVMKDGIKYDIIPCCATLRSPSPRTVDDVSIFENNISNDSEEVQSPIHVISMHVESLIENIRNRFDELSIRVEEDTKVKIKEATLKRLEREKSVLKSKIALAFHKNIDRRLLYNIINKMNISEEETVPDFSVDEKDVDAFTKQEGLDFILSEIDEKEIPDLAKQICELIGYQRLALQIIGAFKSPINSKKVALSWEEIYDIVLDIRNQLGLQLEI